MWVNSEMASPALRVLAFAYRPGSPNHHTEEPGFNLVCDGFVGIINRAQDEVHLAIQKCVKDRIWPVMSTGAHPATALAVARGLGLVSAEERAITGRELAR